MKKTVLHNQVCVSVCVPSSVSSISDSLYSNLFIFLPCTGHVTPYPLQSYSCVKTIYTMLLERLACSVRTCMRTSFAYVVMLTLFHCMTLFRDMITLMKEMLFHLIIIFVFKYF